MGLFDKSKSNATQQDGKKPRWKKLMDLGDNAQVWDISTGKKYRIGQFEPLYKSETALGVDEFGVKATSQTNPDGRRYYGETVAVAFLRLPEDRIRCSLGGM